MKVHLRDALARVRMMADEDQCHTWDLSERDRASLTVILDRFMMLEKETASMSAELGLPPTIRPAEGELRRMQKALEREAKLEAVLREILELAEDEKLLFIAVRAAEVLDEAYP